MKRIFLYLIVGGLLSSCSIMGPAFTGLLSGPTSGSVSDGLAGSVGVGAPVGVPGQAGRRYTPAEDPATGLYGYINDLGMWVIPPRFESVQSFGSNGMARVRLGGRYGVIDPSGQFVIPAVFSSSGDAAEAMQSITKGRMTGLELWAQEDPASRAHFVQKGCKKGEARSHNPPAGARRTGRPQGPPPRAWTVQVICASSQLPSFF